MLKALVSGSNGFVGSHLVRLLKQQGIDVTVVPHAMLLDPIYLASLNKEVYDYIFHLAAYGNMYHQKENDKIIEANIVTTYNLLRATEYMPYKAFIYSSTSSVYGSPQERMSEAMKLEPTTMYGATKAAAEHILGVYAAKGKPVISARLFSIYGEGEADFRLIPIVCKALQQGTAIQLDAKATHTWIYIEDVCRAIVGLTKFADRLKGKAINVGSLTAKSNLEIVRILEKISGKKLSYTEIDNIRGDHPRKWECDTSLLHMLGLEPKVSLQKGLANVYAYVSRYTQVKE